MNSVCITGRLTKDPEVTYTGSQNCIAKFSAAVRRDFHRDGDPDSDFFDVVTFAKTAEFVEKNVTKGMKLEITGRLQQDRWKDKDGNNRSRIVIVAEKVSFAESKASSQQNAPAETSEPKQTKEQKKQPAQDTGFLDIPDDIDEELPFA